MFDLKMSGHSSLNFNNHFQIRFSIASVYQLTIMFEHCNLTTNWHWRIQSAKFPNMLHKTNIPQLPEQGHLRPKQAGVNKKNTNLCCKLVIQTSTYITAQNMHRIKFINTQLHASAVTHPQALYNYICNIINITIIIWSIQLCNFFIVVHTALAVCSTCFTPFPFNTPCHHTPHFNLCPLIFNLMPYGCLCSIML
jgi:hypothetical protein